MSSDNTAKIPANPCLRPSSKNSSSEDTANTHTVPTGNIHESCTSNKRVFVISTIIQNTTTERVPEFRARKQQSAQQHVKIVPKTAAERAREYRSRKRKRKNKDHGPSSENNVLDSSICENSTECVFLIDKTTDKRIPKTSKERTREYRARKKIQRFANKGL